MQDVIKFVIQKKFIISKTLLPQKTSHYRNLCISYFITIHTYIRLQLTITMGHNFTS